MEDRDETIRPNKSHFGSVVSFYPFGLGPGGKVGDQQVKSRRGLYDVPRNPRGQGSAGLREEDRKSNIIGES